MRKLSWLYILLFFLEFSPISAQKSAALALQGRDFGSGQFRREQFVDTNAKATRNLFEGFQTGVVLYPKLLKLEELLTDATSFRRLFLRPAKAFPQRTKALPKDDCGRRFRHRSGRFAPVV